MSTDDPTYVGDLPGDDESTGGPAFEPVATERAGDQIGPYKLIEQLGEGGFGTVWLAERREPYVQRVALKLIKAGLDTKAVIARFRQERQAMAAMSHPNIAKVYDGGLTPAGRPYFAMEYVKGEPITTFCDRAKLGIEDRLRLFEQACEAILHAHLKSIVHRDITPRNILAYQVEGEGPRVKVIDFGLAKAMGAGIGEQSVHTGTNRIVGTPAYMSPEQADPSSSDIDSRTDVYSLGVLLYELLAGAPPFDPDEIKMDTIRLLAEKDPPSPSDRLSGIASKDQESTSRIERSRGVRTAELVRRLRGELEWIPLKAMRKERQHRYQTALELANDVRAYLDGRPLQAGPESASYRVRKYVRRNRALVAGAGAVAVALVVGLGLAGWQWREAVVAKEAAVVAKDEAVAAKDEAVASEARARESESRATAQLERSNDLLGVITTSTALDAVRRNEITATRRELAVLKELGRDDRFAARLAAAWSDQSLGEPLRGHEGDVISVAFSPDGKTLASGSEDKTIRLWDATTGNPLGEPLRGHEGLVISVAFSPDGKTLASGSEDKTIRLWDATTGKPLGEPLRGHEKGVSSVAFSPDGKTLVSGSYDKMIRLWDAATGKQLGEPLRGHDYVVSSVAFSPDGKTLASGSQDTTIRLWSAIPMRERVMAYRARMDELDTVRVQLAERIARVDDSIDSVQALDAEVRADPRFTGDLRTAALLVVGEVDVARREVRTRKAAEERRKRAEDATALRERLKPLEDALGKKDWALALQLVAAANPDDLARTDASFWNALAWRGLTELPAESPARDLKQLLTYAERAVALSERKDDTILDTLARAHWELGDKAKALEVQREAIAALTAQIAAAPADTPAETIQQRQTMLAELQATLEKYERKQPPAPRVAPPAP